jgi:kinesin family protein 3/17
MQRHIYDVCAAPVVKFVLEGYNGTVFAEGQMGSGQSETSLRRSPHAFERIFDTSPLVYGDLLAQSSPRLELLESEWELFNERPQRRCRQGRL